MHLYAPITKVDKEQRMVWGYASTEARDDQGEVVKREALSAALPEYMKLGNVRQMHQLSAVGKAKEAQFDDNGLFIGVKIVDPLAWDKIVEGVYNGFSIGGKVTKRDTADRSIITGIILSEISVVDRPANPEALFEVWKASITEGNSDMAGLATLGDLPAGQKLAGALTEPVQVWHCGDNAHKHAGKAEAVRCIEKQAASGANGGTQWEPLAKGEAEPQTETETETESTPTADAVDTVDTVVEGTRDIAAESQPDDVPSVEDENSTEKSEEISSSEGTAAGVVTTEEKVGTAAATETVEKSAVADEVVTPEEKVVPESDAPGQAEPTATEQAIAKAAEVAALARAALKLPVEPEAEAAVEEVAKANDGDADDKASDDKPKGDYGSVEYADPGYQSDGKPRYPIDTAEHVRAAWSYINQEKNHQGYTAEQVAKIKAKIVSAWKAKIDKAGPPAASKASLPEIFGVEMLSKGLVGTAGLIDTMDELERLGAMLRWRAVHEGGAEIALAACALSPAAEALRGLVAVPELEVEEDELTALAAKTGGIPGWINRMRAHHFGDLADVVEKAAGRHSAKNQMLIDKAYECAMQCASMDGCTKSMSDHLDAACKMMSAAGAHGYGETSAHAAAEKSIVAGELGIIAKAGGHQALLDMAHFCLASMGNYCPANKGVAEETGIKAAHDHLCMAGANCSGGATMKAAGAEGSDKLAKARTENETLRKSLGDVVSLVEQLVGKIDAVDEKVTRIDSQELPPRGLVRTAGLGITKAQDNGAVNGIGPGTANFNNDEDIIKAVDAMPSSQDKAFLLMRLAHLNPRPVNVISVAEAGMGAAQ